MNKHDPMGIYFGKNWFGGSILGSGGKYNKLSEEIYPLLLNHFKKKTK